MAALLADAQRKLDQKAAKHAPANDGVAELFHVVDMSRLERADIGDDAQGWYWADYLPPGHVSLLGGHGGAGKSQLALHLAACVGMGAEAFGRPTRRARALVFSAEDPADLVLQRLRRIGHALGFPLNELQRQVQVLDATDCEPVLFAERRIEGLRHGATTPTYDTLAEYVATGGFDFVVIDNCSDVYDADEINRPLVRAFIRRLVQLVRGRGGAVLLLAHVDKLTSRSGKAAGTEAYSGSTAWHNSVRSRLFLLEVEPGQLELQHQKCNLAPRQAPMRLEWPEGGVMLLPQQAGGFVAAVEAKNDTRTLLELVHEFSERGESVSTATTSRTSASALFGKEKRFPRGLEPADVFALLRGAERAGLIRREQYRGEDRKPRERWALTVSGHALIGVAATAATSPRVPE